MSQITPQQPPNPYKNTFDSSAYNIEKYQALLRQFQSINYFYWYEYPQYPYGNKIGGNTFFLLGKNLIESKNIAEFRARSLGIIPNADLDAISSILTAFVPVYREVIFASNKAGLEKQMALLRQKIKETDISAVVEKIKHFHRSSWNSNPFRLNLNAVKAGNYINGSAFFNYSSSPAREPAGHEPGAYPHVSRSVSHYLR